MRPLLAAVSHACTTQHCHWPDDFFLHPFARSVSAYKLRASLAKHALRFYGTGGTASLLSRIKWASQLKPRPPTFVLLLRGSDEVDEGGQRFLANLLRQSCGMQGVPLRLYLRWVNA